LDITIKSVFALETLFFYENKKKNKEDTLIFKELQINQEIRAKEVRLLDNDKKMLGVVTLEAAQKMADSKSLDLVLISPTASPVVCQIMDYAKFRYERIKQEKEERKKQTTIELKELWLSAVIDIGDLKTKAKKAREFIENGDRVRLTIRMKGRQLAHPEKSYEIMDEFFKMVSDIASIEKAPLREARTVAMIIAPIKKIK
jgi:translation initiation factor IF-3